MFSIAALQSKGGTSKSTVTINVGIAAVCMGLKVALIDTDVQRSTANWFQRRHHSPPAVFAMEATRLKSWLSGVGQDFDLCIIDTPGHDWKSLCLAAVAVDLPVIVSRPTQFDLEAAMQVRNLLEKAGLAHASLITQAPPQVSRRLHHWLQTYAAISAIIDTPLTYLVAYQDAAALGLGVGEYEPGGRAAREVDAVLQWIWRRLRENR